MCTKKTLVYEILVREDTMADLDDFFAKKDAKKKGKKNTVTTDELAKKLQEPEKRVEKPKKEKEKTSTTTPVNNLVVAGEDDNEWKEVEEKDYSGLKIQSLSLKDKEEELREQKAFEVEQENKKDEVGGPWKGAGGTAAPGEDEEEDEDDKSEASEPEKPPTPDLKKSSYVPPHMRNKPLGETSAPGGNLTAQRMSMAGRVGYRAPQLDNAEEFPTLGDGPAPELGKDFKLVKHGARELTSNRQPSANLALNNKYKALSSNSRDH
ncbi:hypothetical protein HDE_13667 [Halotydeus destructor]|nr:hypothetical protein HDE_13667 [Halotydeus destructor]